MLIKDNTEKIGKLQTEGEYLINISHQGFVPRIYEEPSQTSSKNINKRLEKMTLRCHCRHARVSRK